MLCAGSILVHLVLRAGSQGPETPSPQVTSYHGKGYPTYIQLSAQAGTLLCGGSWSPGLGNTVVFYSKGL